MTNPDYTLFLKPVTEEAFREGADSLILGPMNAVLNAHGAKLQPFEAQPKKLTGKFFIATLAGAVVPWAKAGPIIDEMIESDVFELIDGAGAEPVPAP